ncbi:MAG: Glycosyl transferase, family 2 [uncultured Thermomicrobiales bacterium]|uniref:Glycosyl transferase, family 2 n=1 Tax=uncultured Thermomicrobiales bacterium TaxID=1645740 RepID=A0A6J4VX27_9BACT|nr:MAG: Glycosyl transferase, family 2 [uncultured Thermomicrobiales bacterium]
MHTEPPDRAGCARSALPLTVVVLTRDEERDLPGCLASVADLGAPTIVLDSGSTDRTVALARAHGARVHTRPFTGYASQRNAALALAASRWVLFLDADERLTTAGCEEIRAILSRPDRADDPVGYGVPRHNEFFGRRVRGGGWWPDYQLRLLRPDRARYDESREVHEVVILDGPEARLVEPLIHRNYDSWGEFCAKQRAYAERHARDLARRSVRPRSWTYGTMPVREFRRRYFTLDARRDGRLGLALSLAMAWYEGRAYWQLGRLVRQVGDLRGRSGTVPITPLLPRPLFRLPPELDLSVIIVSRDTRALTLGCLAAVGRSLAGAGVTWEGILVDNASGDGTVAAVRAAYPAVRVIEAGGNRGFAVGNNLGLREARGRALLLLNPDTEALDDAIPRLLAALHADPALGAVGPALRYPDGTPQEARRRFPTRLTPFVESTVIQGYWRRNRILDRYYLADRPTDRPQDVDWLYGACLLIRREALAASGGFDEGFFMYSEELDLCARIRARGWRIGYDPGAVVVHHEGASSGQAVPRRQINFNTSKVRFYRRRYGALFGEALRLFLLLTFVLQLAQEGGKWLLGHKRPLRRQRVGAYLAVIRSGLRPTGEHLKSERGARNAEYGPVENATLRPPSGLNSAFRAPRSDFKRVLLVTGEYPPTVGGVGDYTAALAAHLREVGVDASILTGAGDPSGAEAGVLRAVPDWGVRGWPTIGRAIGALRPDLIHIQYQAGAFTGRGGIVALPWWLARRGGPPVVITFHDRCAPYLFPKAGPIRPLALHALARAGAATIATNGDDWAALRADPQVARQLQLIPIGSNIPPLPPEGRDKARTTTRAALGVGSETPIIAYFGLVGASKGLDLLLDALARAAALGLDDFRLLLIGGEASATDGARFDGDGDLAGALRARGLTARTILTDTLPATAVAAHLAAADLAVLPYRDGASWRRGSLLAALAAGVPTITTRPPPGYAAAGVLPTLTDGEQVALVPPDDVDALAAAIVRLAGDAAGRARLAAGGRAVAAHFDWATIARAHRDLYAHLMQRSPQRRRGGR